MPNLASSPRKPNPPAMPRSLRLTSVLWTRNPPRARIRTTNNSWRTRPRTLGSCHGGGRVGLSAAPAVSLAIVVLGRQSADRHRVDQAALGPQIVEPAFELERRALTEVA